MIRVEGPEKVAAEPKSFTGQYLKPLLQKSAHPEEPQSGVSKDSSPAKAGAQAAKRTRRKSTSSEDQRDLIPAK